MYPGPVEIYQCHGCDNLFYRETIYSGNMFGAILFSDGKRIAPGMPDIPKISKCPKCKNFFWFENTNPIEEIQHNSWRNLSKDVKNDELSPPIPDADRLKALRKATPATFPTLTENLQALEESVFSSNREELYLRTRIWWEFNDRVRAGQAMFTSRAERKIWKGNCQRLFEILDYTNTNDKIMAAELDRNLGNFEGCMKILMNLTDSRFCTLIEQFATECRKKNTFVFQFTNKLK